MRAETDLAAMRPTALIAAALIPVVPGKAYVAPIWRLRVHGLSFALASLASLALPKGLRSPGV